MSAHPRHRSSGFTLIELMVVLTIIILMAGIGMYGSKHWRENQELNKPLDELKVMAKKAWHRAIAEQRDWEIVIRVRSLELRPKQAAAQEDQRFLNEADKAMGRGDGVEFVAFNPDIRIAIRRFGEEKWADPRPDNWVFQHSGLCEPIMIRVEREGHWVEAQFDPLTAGVQRQEQD